MRHHLRVHGERQGNGQASFVALSKNLSATLPSQFLVASSTTTQYTQILHRSYENGIGKDLLLTSDVVACPRNLCISYMTWIYGPHLYELEQVTPIWFDMGERFIVVRQCGCRPFVESAPRNCFVGVARYRGR